MKKPSADGFAIRHVDPVTGDLICPASAAESALIRSLLWVPGHMKLISQVALPRRDTLRIAQALGIRHPVDIDHQTMLVMTTDVVHLCDVEEAQS